MVSKSDPLMEKTYFKTCRSIQLLSNWLTVTTTPAQKGTLNFIPSKTGIVEMAIGCRIEDIYLKSDTISLVLFSVTFFYKQIRTDLIVK